MIYHFAWAHSEIIRSYGAGSFQPQIRFMNFYQVLPLNVGVKMTIS